MSKFCEHLPVGIVAFQEEGPHKVLHVNEAFEKDTGYTQQELMEISGSISEYLGKDELNIIRIAVKEAKRTGCSGEFEIHMKNKDGEYQWYVFRVSYEADEQMYIMATWNIDERKRMEEELYVQSERYTMVEELTGELPFEFDVESGEVLVSRKYLAMCGMENTLEHFAKPGEMMSIIYKQDIENFFNAMEEASRQEVKSTLEMRLKISGDAQQEEYAWYRLIYKSIYGMNRKVIRIVGRMENINQAKLEHYQLSERAKRDALTGVLNKAATKEEVESFLVTAVNENHAMMVIDIDNFKDVNDNFGHLFGDAVLISVAENIVSVFRKNDIIGRVGGDEFLVLMKNVEQKDVEEKAECLCKALRQQYNGEKQNANISCSVGIAFYDKNGKTYQELFEKADYAMYQAKDSGKNQYRFAENEKLVAGFRKPGRERNTEHREGLDEGFLTATFSLLSHAKDVNISLNLLLERIGKRYDLDVVAVLESYKEEQEFVQTNCWKKKSGIVENPVHRARYADWELYMTGFDERGILCVDNYEALEKLGKEATLRSGRKISALINCSFQSQDGEEGMVVFCKMDKEYVWNEFEKETFLEISRIVSIFVALKRNQRESWNKILSLQSRDLVTGLLNEAAFRQQAQEKIAHMDKSMQYAIIYTDIREFWYVNENFGVEAGNELLKKFAACISAPPRGISCRMYSDLFVTLVWDDSREKIQCVAEKMLQGFMQEQHGNYPQGNMRLIAGIYFIEHENEDIDIAIENANLTRKRIKLDTGRTVCQIYTEEIRLQREQEQRIMWEFEKTLQERRFKVFVQPKFFLRSKTAAGGEALVRWIKEDGSMAFPNDFIPIIERTGQIIKLDFYVLEQVLKYLQKWKKEGRELYRISVNFSRKHFEDQGIYQKVCELTEKYRIEHKYIEIEITEGLLVSGLDMVKTEMELLKKAGFAVAIDDFGTGYSSLSMLHDIPADVVKIDKSFLDRRDIDEEKDFIEKIGALIHSVKEEIVFEGIETERQLEFLVDCGFRYGQGFLYDRPMPIEVFEEKYMK